jgi:hypothetical protein
MIHFYWQQQDGIFNRNSANQCAIPDKHNHQISDINFAVKIDTK